MHSHKGEIFWITSSGQICYLASQVGGGWAGAGDERVMAIAHGHNCCSLAKLKQFAGVAAKLQFIWPGWRFFSF